MHRPIPPLVVAGLALLAVGCGAEPSVGELPVAAGPGSASAAARPWPGPPPGPPQPAPILLPTGPLEFFREQYGECAQYAALAGRGDDSHPQVEEDRFTDAVLVGELDADTALVEDGRGTRLVVDRWSTMGTVLPESGRADDVMPAPYRLGCSPDRFLGTSG